MTREIYSRTLFPTWVGVILIEAHTETVDASFPHMGGGDPKPLRATLYEIDFSPHGWG